MFEINIYRIKIGIFPPLFFIYYYILAIIIIIIIISVSKIKKYISDTHTHTHKLPNNGPATTSGIVIVLLILIKKFIFLVIAGKPITKFQKNVSSHSLIPSSLHPIYLLY